MEIAPAGDAIVYSTLYGGTGNDYPERIAVDGLGSAFVAGETTSHDFR